MRVNSDLPKGVPALPVPHYEEEDVRPYLAFICKGGYGNQVKAAIESFGVTHFSKLPKESYGEIVEMVRPMYDESLKAVLQAGSSTDTAPGGDSSDK